MNNLILLPAPAGSAGAFSGGHISSGLPFKDITVYALPTIVGMRHFAVALLATSRSVCSTPGPHLADARFILFT